MELEPSQLPVELFFGVIDYGSRSELRVERTLPTLPRVSPVARHSGGANLFKVAIRWRAPINIIAVEELNIRNWTLGLDQSNGRLVLFEDDFELIRDAVITTGLHRIATHILDALAKADPRPLVALLLAGLRNLTTLWAQLPENDVYLSEVLPNAVENRGNKPSSGFPLSTLREAYLASTYNFRQKEQYFNEYKLEFNHLWPVFQLPSLQKLSIFDFEPLGASNHLRDTHKTANITDLTLVYHLEAVLAVPDTLAILALPKALRSFSMYFNDPTLFGRPNQLSNAALWDSLRQHEVSLEHLDVFRYCSTSTPPRHTPNRSHFGPMHGFKRLEHLSIQPELLLGGCCGDDYAPFQLRDTLPSILKSLTLYGDEGLSLNKTLGRQLLDVMAGAYSRALNHVALEATFPNFHGYADSADPPHGEVERACRESGRCYKTKAAAACTKGGKGHQYHCDVEANRQQMVGKLRAVRGALIKHLYELKRLTYEQFEAGQPTLSTEDLDNYELPFRILQRRRQRLKGGGLEKVL